MVFGVSPVTLLVKVPIPVPSVVFVDNVTVGPLDVLQITPLAVTALPPSEVILPPLLIVKPVVFDETAVVVSVGGFRTVTFSVVLAAPLAL